MSEVEDCMTQEEEPTMEAQKDVIQCVENTLTVADAAVVEAEQTQNGTDNIGLNKSSHEPVKSSDEVIPAKTVPSKTPMDVLDAMYAQLRSRTETMFAANRELRVVAETLGNIEGEVSGQRRLDSPAHQCF
jgi:LPS O-antigen subunit length determinant protein (WzzB/FepE family)